MNGVPDVDTQSWIAIQNNDPDAFEKLFRKYYGQLCTYAIGVLGDNEQAEDVVQEVFIYFWEHRKELDVKNSLRAYLFTAVRHRAVKALQKKVMKQKHNSRLTEFVEYLLSTDYTVEEEKAILKVKEIMQSLPEQCLKVFMMSRLEEKKYTEIAQELGISVNTVKTHIAKAYRVIRQGIHDDRYLLLYLLSLN